MCWAPRRASECPGEWLSYGSKGQWEYLWVTLSMACSGALRPLEGTSTPQFLPLAFLYTFASVPTQACKLEANQLSRRQYKPNGIERVKRPFSAFSPVLDERRDGLVQRSQLWCLSLTSGIE